MSKAIPDARLGWMAGVLDTEGSLIRKRNRTRATPQLVLMVESAGTRVVTELARMTGSRPEPSHNHRLRWTLTGAPMAIVLWNVIPFMVTDRGMEDAMTEALAHLVTSGRGVGMVRTAVRRLERAGWKIPPEIEGRISAPVSAAAAARHRKENAGLRK